MAAMSTGDNHISIYDMTDPTTPVFLGSAIATTGTLTANSNGTGGVAWGKIVVNGDGSATADVYGLSTADGISAFQITIPAPVPEPATLSLFALGGLATVIFGKKIGGK